MLSLKEKAVSGFKWQMANRVLTRVIAVGTFAVLARMLEPADFGLFALAFCEASCRGENIEQLHLDESKMREHLLLAFLKNQIAIEGSHKDGWIASGTIGVGQDLSSTGTAVGSVMSTEVS